MMEQLCANCHDQPRQYFIDSAVKARLFKIGGLLRRGDTQRRRVHAALQRRERDELPPLPPGAHAGRLRCSGTPWRGRSSARVAPPRPLVTAVVAAHQAARHLGSALASLAAQTLDDLEVIVVDDGSTDGTAAVARESARSDPRFQPASGSTATAARPRRSTPAWTRPGGATSPSSTPTTRRRPGGWSSRSSAFERDPGLVLVGGAVVTLCDRHAVEGRVWRYATDDAAIRARTLFKSEVISGAVTFDRECMARHAVRFDESLRLGVDWALSAAAMRLGRVGNVEPVVMRYRIHPGQMTVEMVDDLGSDSTRIRRDVLAWAGVHPTDDEMRTHLAVSPCNYWPFGSHPFFRERGEAILARRGAVARSAGGGDGPDRAHPDRSAPGLRRRDPGDGGAGAAGARRVGWPLGAQLPGGCAARLRGRRAVPVGRGRVFASSSAWMARSGTPSTSRFVTNAPWSSRNFQPAHHRRLRAASPAGPKRPGPIGCAGLRRQIGGRFPSPYPVSSTNPSPAGAPSLLLHPDRALPVDAAPSLPGSPGRPPRERCAEPARPTGPPRSTPRDSPRPLPGCASDRWSAAGSPPRRASEASRRDRPGCRSRRRPHRPCRAGRRA